MRNAYEEDAVLDDAIAAWHTAVNGRDLRAARAAITDPVDVSGPRGAGPISAAAFGEWIINSGIRLRPLASHPVAPDTMVVEQEATWPDHPDGAATPPVRVATLFRVREGAVSVVRRFDNLHDALRAAREAGR